jgi:hypothetical protein
MQKKEQVAALVAGKTIEMRRILKVDENFLGRQGEENHYRM